METITKELTIDLYGPTMRYAVEAHQGERRARRLLITVTEQGGCFKLPETDYIALIKKPDGNSVSKICAVVDRKIELILPGNALDKAGKATCEIVFDDENNKQTLITQAFEIEIHPSLSGKNATPASDDIETVKKEVEDLLEKLRKTDFSSKSETAALVDSKIAEMERKLIVIGDTEPETGPVLWFDTRSRQAEPDEDIILQIGGDEDEASVIVSVDGVDYPVQNLSKPTQTSDPNTLTIDII